MEKFPCHLSVIDNQNQGLQVDMSELHRKLFRKQKNDSFSLGSLCEEPQSQVTAEEISDLPDQSDDCGIEHFYINLKEETFPIQEIYTNADGLQYQTYYSPSPSKNAPILVCHHGAGSSSMTFCCLAHYLKNESPEEDVPGIFLFDARGHGNSTMSYPVDFSLLSFTDDFSFVLQKFHTRHNIDCTIFLIGHSLGGAILTNYVMNYDHCSYDIKGLVMIDIVEETAVKALMSISNFINRRPTSFQSYTDAIQWHLNSQLLRNGTSAKISVSDLLRRENDGILYWKSDLSLMADFWDSWFVHLSNNFIKCGLKSKHKIAKLLILSGNETLDKELIIGQMQGKFQLIVFNNTNTGHFLQEDIPKQMGISIMDFVRRNDIVNFLTWNRSVKTKWGGEINP